tara:strand:+ start:32757 stop:33056 length:300 start_codon:yes stop_codon:yes gene_type:complete
MQSLLFKDKKRRKLFIHYEEKKYILKYIQNNMNISKTIREKAYKKHLRMPRNSSVTRVRNRCVLTNRPRAVYKKFKFSRIQLRNLALEGEIPGIRKATW